MDSSYESEIYRCFRFFDFPSAIPISVAKEREITLWKWTFEKSERVSPTFEEVNGMSLDSTNEISLES